jgi:hypothetical protein
MKHIPNKLKVLMPRFGDTTDFGVGTNKGPEEVSEKVRKRRSFGTLSHDFLAMFTPTQQGPTFKFEDDSDITPSLHHSISMRNFSIENQYSFKASGKLEIHKRDNVYKERWVEIVNSDLVIFNKKGGKERLRYPLLNFTLELIGEHAVTHVTKLDSTSGFIFALLFDTKSVQFSALTKDEYKNWIETFHIMELRNFTTIIDPGHTSKQEMVEIRIGDQLKILQGEDEIIKKRFGPDNYKDLTDVYEKKLLELQEGVYH